MFDFEYWFDCIVGTCGLIADNDAFMRTWVLGDDSITSIISYDELFEQLIGDLHLDESIQRFAGNLHSLGALETIRGFARAVHEIESRIAATPELQNPADLLRSQEWRDFQVTAKRVPDLPVAAKYGRNVPPGSPAG